MARRKSAASPLAMFLDYILSVRLEEAHAALDTRKTVPPVTTSIVSGYVPPVTALTGGPVATSTPTPAPRRGRKPGSKNLSTSERMAANAPRRRRRPSVEEDVLIPGPPVNPLPDQTVPDQNEET